MQIEHELTFDVVLQVDAHDCSPCLKFDRQEEACILEAEDRAHPGHEVWGNKRWTMSAQMWGKAAAARRIVSPERRKDNAFSVQACVTLLLAKQY